VKRLTGSSSPGPLPLPRAAPYSQGTIQQSHRHPPGERMNRRIFTTGVAFGLAMAFTGLAPARAQQATAEPPAAARALHQALGALPAPVVENPAAIQAIFVDLAALPQAAWQEGQPSVEALQRLSLAQFVQPFQALNSLPPEQWGQEAGIGLADLSSLTAVEQAATIWRPRDAARIPPLLAHLQTLGFTAGEGGILSSPANVPIMTRMSNPWFSGYRGDVSVGRDGESVVQSISARGVRLFSGVAPDAGALADPPTAAALAGLENQLGQQGAAEDKLIQAALFTPIMTLRGADPAEFLRMSPEQARAAMRQRQETLGQGMPPYLKGILADLQSPAGPALLISLAYPDCGTAETAISRFRAFWDTPGFGQDIPATLSAEAVPQGSLCAAALLLRAEERPGLANPLLRSILDAYGRRARTPLDIF
jgi:hypothetical protein